MTTTREKLLPASYEQVPFLVEGETKEGGKKTVTHEYVNSDKRFTEEQGKLPPKFTIEAIVHGDDAIQQRKNLEGKLDTEGIGLLKHPVYGDLLVKSTTYTVSSNQRAMGEFRFSINFETTEAEAPDFQALETTEKVVSDADKGRESLDNALEDQWQGPGVPATLEKVAGKADNVYETVFNKISAVTNTIQDNVSSFTQTVATARSKIFSLVQKPAQIKSALKDLYASALNIVNIPADLMDAWKDLTDFGFVKLNQLIGGTSTSGVSTNSAEVNTNQRIQEDIDRNILDDHTRLTCFVNFMEAAAFKEFETTDEIVEIRESLNDIYTNQIENMYVGENKEVLTKEQLAQYTPLAILPEVRRDIQALRTTVNRVLDQKSQTAWKVETITPDRSSMALTAYRYYENLDNLDSLRNLNPGVNSSNFDGSIQGLTK